MKSRRTCQRSGWISVAILILILFPVGGILSNCRVLAQASPESAGSASPIAGTPAAGQSSANHAQAGESAGGTVQFAAMLPSFFESNKSFTTEKEGILVPEHTYVRTRQGNYLNRDFRLDLWLTVDPKLPTAFIGVGSGVDGMHATPVNSIYMAVNPNGDISLATREGYGDESIGNELDPGEYLVRIEKTGSAVTFSIGSETNGEFEPDVTRTFADISKTPAEFNDKNMHVFFGGGRYRQFRFGPDAPPPVNVIIPKVSPQQAGFDIGPSNSTQWSAALPPELECDGTFSVFKDRIVIPEHTYFRTKMGDFLHKDFVLDLWLTIDPKRPKAFIGVGSGRNGNQAEPVNSIFMAVQPDGRIDMQTREGYGGDRIGTETDSGVYVVRLQKTGMAVTYSIGSEKDGQFAPDFTRTFADITKTPAEFNDKNMHLFFGGGEYRQIRFSTSEQPAPPVVQPAPAVAPNAHAAASFQINLPQL